jgi:Zn-dependent protease
MNGTLATSAPDVTRCACGSEVAAGLLACPGCRKLIHAERLKALAERAAAAAREADRPGELAAWREALLLVPIGTRQHSVIDDKIAALAADAPVAPAALEAPTSPFWKWVVGLGPIGVVVWKLKFLIVMALANGKMLLLGLTKASTFLSMLLAFGVYWTAWGMWFALGLVLSIYIHEMGHVVALQRFGIPATAPMFVPGLGAFIRLRQATLAPPQNARVGLAGPLWGLGAAATAWFLSRAGGGDMWAAIAHTGAWLNLFNLLPVWQLDGNRAFSALGRVPRLTIAAAFAAAGLLSGDGLLFLLAIVAAARAFDPQAPEDSDGFVWAEFLFLITTLAIILRFSPVRLG